MRLLVLAAACVLAVGCGSGSPFDATLGSIGFETLTVPPGGAGQLYNVQVRFETTGGALPPERFTITVGALPPGVQLLPDRADLDLDGVPDADAPLTGHARLIGFPRETGSFSFTLKAISTGGDANAAQPDLAATRQFLINVAEGSVAILTPTAAEGTTDAAVPAFPEVVPFVNPANPNAFFGFAWEIAGGSNSRINTVYLPRELELSTFDAAVVADPTLMDFDTIEGGDPFEVNFADGGLFVLGGNEQVQIGGFPSPRGPVGTIVRHAGGAGLDPVWFQRAPGPNGPAQHSRRFVGDPAGANGDTTLGAPLPVRFSDYFDPKYEGTDPSASPRRKYPFTADQYQNAFFSAYVPGVDLTSLKYRIIVESIDTRGTTTNRDDDVIARRAYIMQVQVPPIAVDTVVLPAGRAGVDYTEFVNGSGGVPPLKYDLEHVDGIVDGQATANGPGELTKAMFGIELGTMSGQFFGAPRASGTVELTVRVYADVMNATQGGNAAVPTGGAGELDGTHPLTGKTGRHKTIPVDFDTPLPLVVATKALVPGVDGFVYPGDRLVGAGGVPHVVPDPVGFVGTYPSATAVRTYAWDASYIKDESYGTEAGDRDLARKLPNALSLDGDATSANNGVISGMAYDRGFHTIDLVVSDFYVGDASAPDAGASSIGTASVPLSISPDRAVYMRGMQSSEGNGEPTGLLDATAAMSEPRMVPMFLSAAVVKGSTGQQPTVVDSIPGTVDLLPVMLANGGSDAHVDKSIPSISGFWPAESDREYRWSYYYYGVNEEGFKHLQQELCWLQAPGKDHRRVFLWGQTKIKQFSSGDTTTNLGRRYQAYDTSGKRGVMVLDPLTGDFWFPAILSNAAGGQDGSQFGAEYVMGNSGTTPTNSNYGYIYTGYEEYYNYAAYAAGTREPRLIGLGSYLEVTDNSSSGKRSNGRTATSVAMSADGKWCATALPGAGTPKLLVWRTDKLAITGMGGKSYIRLLTGKDADGNDLTASAAIFDLGGQVAGVTLSSNMRHLLPDSVMFVRDGLLFLMENRSDYVFGLSLVDGHLSGRSVNSSRTQLVSGMGTGPSATTTNGMYVPEKGFLRGVKAEMNYSSQFSFVGNEPQPGWTGPDKVAFVAGTNYELVAFADYNSTYTNLSSDSPRKGYAQGGNRAKCLLFLELANGGAGLELSAATLKDLTGGNSQVNGDLLTPGRYGEDLDFIAVSPDGQFVACVRDDSSNGTLLSTYYSYNPCFATNTTSSTTSYYRASDDLLLVSTLGVDMDSGKNGTQPVLFVGSGTVASSYTGTPAADAASYCSAAAWLNAYGRRVCGVQFTPDSRTLLFKYQGDNTYYCKYFGSAYQYGLNGDPWFGQPYQGMSAQLSLRFHFRTASDGAIDFKSSNDAQNFLKNNLEGLTGVGAIGDTSAPFTNASPYQSGGADQQFWCTFKSPDGRFQYFVSDPPNGRNFLVGFNMTGADVNGHAPFEPFSPHASTVGFEQFDNCSWNYEFRFAAVPAGVVNPVSGRDGSGIVFIIGSDASAGATNAVDLEVYAFDANIGGDLYALTSDVTDGKANAINHIYASAAANVLVGQRCKTTANGGPNRGLLNSTTDLFAVTNVHEVLAGGTPNAFVVNASASHGATVAVVGGGTALIYTAGDAGTSNSTWSKRHLRIQLLTPGSLYDVIDSNQSHYVVLAGGRKIDDDPTDGD